MRRPPLGLVRRAGLVWLLFASSASAQPSIQKFLLDGLDALDKFNKADCEDNQTRTREIQIQFAETRQYFLHFSHAPAGLSPEECGNDLQDQLLIPVEGPKAVTPQGSNLLDLTEERRVAQLLGEDACGEGDGARLEGGYYCMHITLEQNDITSIGVGRIRIDYDTTLPPAIKIEGAVAGNNEITLTVSGVPQDDGEDYDVVFEHRECGGAAPPDAGAAAESICGATGDFETTPIRSGDPLVIPVVNGTTIEVRAFLRDDFGNEGPRSDAITVEAKAVLGTLDLYNGKGGELSCAPSCGTSTLSAAFGLGFLFLLSRRGRRLLSWSRGTVLWVVVLFLSSSSARAEFGQTTLSLSVAPYKPDIDSEVVDGERIFPIYACLFDGQNVIEGGFDVDTHLIDEFGSLQLTLGVQMSQARGKAQPLEAAVTGKCEKPTETPVELSMLKIRPGITYRLDPLLDHYEVPLVPYGRLGLIGAAYAFTKEGQFEDGGVNPAGMRFGWEAAAGLALALDFLDKIDPFVPDTTRRGRANGVFNHTFLFGEAAYQSIDTFRSPGLVLSPVDEFFYTRLPVVWRLGVSVELL